MRIVQINAACSSGSTGRICEDLSRGMTAAGIENHVLYFTGHSSYPLAIKCADNKYIRAQALKSRIFGNDGFNSSAAAKKAVSEIERLDPDIIHLHNIHGHSVNLNILFDHIRSHGIKTLWTFHDCWAFTGYCMYFDTVDCHKWKTSCNACPKRKKYSWFFDRSGSLFARKKALFSGIDMTVITPSQWLADLVGQSFLSEHPVKVIHNGIDLNVFKPTPSDFRQRYSIPADTYILLGVSFEWEDRKGLDVFLDLANKLDDNRYRIVLVGTNDSVDNLLPENIISIHRTQDANELAQIYTAADLFVNPTREENYPTVNMESLACGTPVITFPTGGSPEMLSEDTGCVARNSDDMAAKITDICENGRYLSEDCVRRARVFCDKNKAVSEYLELYDTVRF